MIFLKKDLGITYYIFDINLGMNRLSEKSTKRLLFLTSIFES